MNVTATLIGQIIVFALLIWFVNRFLWGPLTRVMEDRKQRIADDRLCGGNRNSRKCSRVPILIGEVASQGR